MDFYNSSPSTLLTFYDIMPTWQSVMNGARENQRNSFTYVDVTNSSLLSPSYINLVSWLMNPDEEQIRNKFQNITQS